MEWAYVKEGNLNFVLDFLRLVWGCYGASVILWNLLKCCHSFPSSSHLCVRTTDKSRSDVGHHVLKRHLDSQRIQRSYVFQS